MSEKGATGEVYHIGNPEEIAIRDVAHMVGAYFGRTLTLEHQPLQKGGTPRRCPDISKIAALGYAPKVMLAEGFPILADWYIANQ